MILAGKTALVTGGGRGIGKAIALRFAREGADVAVNYSKSAAEAESVAAAIRALGRRSLAVQADVSDPSQARRMVDEVSMAFGGIDILVNNAGILFRNSIFDITEAEWDRVLDVDLKSYFFVSREAARVMRDAGTQGRILNISSSSAKTPSSNLAHYCVAKAGVSMLTKVLSVALAPHHITVNEICPGLTETDINRKDIADAEFREGRMARIPLKKIGQPDDLAGAALYLVSDEAHMVTGASLAIDAGSTVS